MRGKKYKKLLTWLLCICLMAGMIPNSAFAISVNAQQQEQTTVAKQETKEDQTKEEKTEQTQTTEQTKDSTKSEATTESTKETTTEQKSTTEEKKNEEKQDNKAAKQSADQKKKIAVQSSTAKVTAVKLLEKEGTTDVWGTGIQTGSTDLDDKSWDGTEETRGYDDSISNEIIRSFDTINYNVTSTIDLKKGETHTLVYEVTLPDDDELTLDQSKMNTSDITCQKNADGTKTYTCKYTLAKDYDGGEKTENIVLKVGNKHQGDTIKPTIKSYLDDDKDNALKAMNMETVTVTTAPMYNIVLKKHTSESHTRDIYEFNQGYNADGYTDNKVNGYKCTYGFALEIRKPGNGIKGVELPDPDKDFEFDIDLSNSTLAGKNMPDEGFLPLLYYVGANTPGGAAVAEIPFTKESTLAGYEGRGCYNSGNVSMTQNGTTLHVKVKDFKIDESKFPSKNGKGDSYWQDANKILEGVFSAYQFQVVYPYINEKGENLQDKIGDGTVNVEAVVKNMNATSETNTNTTEETTLKDNSQSNNWELQSGNARNQAIFYSSRKVNGIIDSYSTAKIRDDGDIAAVGADDLAFTVSYNDGKAGEAYGKEGLPTAIDQFVLFDSSAIKNVEFAQTMQQGIGSNASGYGCTVRYAVHKGGHLDNETMRTAKLEDFDFYDTKPEGVDVDGVLVQYRGMNLGPTNLKLHAQFNATVNSDYKTADKVYMVTAFTNVWTVSDCKDEILAATGKDSLDKVTMNEISAWGKAKDVKEATALVKDKDRNDTNTIDNRDYYTVPEYKQGVYSPGSDHKFSQGSADGLYVVPYTTTVTKTVAQTDESGKPLQRYNIGKGQRYVDYRITSAMRYWADVKPVEGDTTTVYLEDTIPKGLTYVSNSAYWGGTYTSKYPSAGVVRDGQQIEPASIEEKADGSTVLKWEIPNVALTNGELPELHYSCEISKDVNDNKTLENTVTIQTNEDKRSIHKENDNISTAAITVTKDNEFYIVKRGGDSLELQDNSYYDLVAANTSSQDKKDLCIFDTMPYAGDSKSTQFKGQYKITGLTMNAKDVNHADDMEVWYTDNAKYIGKTANSIDPSEITEANGWKKADASGYDTDTITFTGDGLIGGWPTVIAYKDANLEKNTIATLRLEYEAAAGAENDDFVNSWTTMSNGKQLRSDAETDIYKRSIEGTVWYDKDKDGKIDKDETKLKDVKVTLLVKDKDGNYVEYTGYKETDKDGNTKQSSSVTYTDEDGHYKFDGLPTGDYRVKFESSDGADLGYYDVTTPNADTDKTVTSKVEKENVTKDDDGKLTSGTIKDITMPTLDKLITDKNKHYNLPDQNLGLIVPTTDIFVMKAWDDAENQDGIRPTSIEVTLYKNGKATDQKLTLTKDGNWNGEFKDLPKYDDTDPQHLTENTYEVKEVSKVDGYTSQVSPVTGKTENGYIVTNTHTPSKINIPVQKTWNDADNQDGKRPDQITIHLYADGEDTGKTLVLNESNNWSGTFTDLDEYKNGNKIDYTVEEDTVKDYASTITGSAEEGYVVKNTYEPDSFGPPDGSDTTKTTKNTKDKNTKNSSQTSKSAKTGDTNAVIPWMIVCAVSLGAIVLFRRKKTQK